MAEKMVMHKINTSPGGRINIKMSSYQYRKSHCGDKTILRPSYLHNGISYTGKTTSLYWIRAQDSICYMKHQNTKIDQYINSNYTFSKNENLIWTKTNMCLWIFESKITLNISHTFLKGINITMRHSFSQCFHYIWHPCIYLIMLQNKARISPMPVKFCFGTLCHIYRVLLQAQCWDSNIPIMITQSHRYLFIETRIVPYTTKSFFHLPGPTMGSSTSVSAMMLNPVW